MAKRIVATFLLCVMLCVQLNISAFTSTDECADFLGNYYEVFSYDFDDSAVYDWGTVSGDVADTSVLKICGSCDLLKGCTGFVGKSYFSFDLMADAIENYELTVSAKTPDGQLFDAAKLELAGIDTDVRVLLNNTDSGAFLAGQWVKFELLFDGTAGAVDVIVSSAIGEIIRKRVSFEHCNAILSGLTLNGSGNLYLDNIRLCRGIRCNGNNTAIYADGSYISACSEISADKFLYLAQYRDNRLMGCSVAENIFDSPYTETYLDAEIKQGDVFKAFVWSDALNPSKVSAAVENEKIVTTDFVMNGSISAEDVAVGEQIDFDISFSDGYNGNVAVIICSKEGHEIQTAQKANDKFSWTPQKSGEYIVWLYTVNGNILVPAANSTFYAAPCLKDEDTFMFPAEKSYYVHNGVKEYYGTDGFVPLLNNGHLYLGADMIKRISGIDVSGNTVSYLGEVLLEFDEYTGAATDGSGYTLNIKSGQYSFGDLCALIGYKSGMQEDVLCVTRQNDVSIYDYEDLLFEFVANKKSSGFYNWSTLNSVGGEYDSVTDIHTVAAIQKAYAGYSYRFLRDDFDAYMYEVSFDVMYSDDAENIAPFVGMWTMKDGNFYAIYHGSDITDGKKGEWTRVTSSFAKHTLDNSGFDELDKFYVGIKPSGSGTAAGSLMFKNVRIREKSIMNESVESEIVCKNFASWHTLGETVSFTPKDENISQFESIYGAIYDIDEKKVFEKTVSTRSFVQNGWNWNPQVPGYYEAEFYGIRSDGSTSIIVNCYSHKYKGVCTAYTLPRHSVAVVKDKAKPMEQRCDLLMLSDDAMSENNIRLADMVGFSGIRIHGVHWGDSVQNGGFHKGVNTFDWTNTDLQINNVKKYGFKNVIANIFGTPRWAVTDESVVNKGYTSVGLYTENCFVPDDISVVSEGFGAYADRYKNDVDGIEVWNEPSYGNTAFWYQGNMSNEEMYNSFAALTAAAYDAIDEKAPDITVYTAGFNQAYKLFEALLENDEYASSFDAVSCHGRYSDCDVYFDILSENGMGDIPVINSEGYFHAYYKKGAPKDYRANNMVFISHYLQHIKSGADKITHFSLLNVTEDELRVHNNGSNSAGLFRKYPYIEPLQGAVIAYNFFDGLGKDVSFGSEYDFGNGIKAVSINSDGEVQIYLWNANDNSFYIPGELVACINGESFIVDFEGKSVEKNSQLSAKRIYCIKNADSARLSELACAPDAVLNSDYVAPYYTCRTESGSQADTYTPISGVFTTGALFDNESFADNDIKEYNNLNSVWIPVNDGICDCEAKYALSFDTDGMYIEAVVTDSEHCAGAASGADIIKYDGIRFAIDSYGRLRNTERSEFFVGSVNGQPSVYKYYAADLSEALVDNWSPSGAMLDGNYVDIQRDNGVTVYKVYIPYSEVYPFRYVDDNEVRFALAVCDNDSGVQKGCLSYGEGIASDAPQVWKYARMVPAS